MDEAQRKMTLAWNSISSPVSASSTLTPSARFTFGSSISEVTMELGRMVRWPVRSAATRVAALELK